MMRLLEGGVIFGLAAACLAAANSSGPLEEPLTVSAGTPHSTIIPLRPLVIPPAGTLGLLVKARINDGPPLRLLLDSGSQFLVIDRKAARKSGLTAATEMDLVGAGATPRNAHQAVAATVDVEGITLHSCQVVVTDEKVLDGIDGVFPLALFSGFMVNLDVPRKVVELRPYPEDGFAEEPGFVPVRKNHNMLFLPANLNGRHAGYLLLDTGSAFNAISDAAARALKNSSALAPEVSLWGGARAAQGRVYSEGVSFRLGGRVMEMRPVVSVDLSEMTRRNGLDVSGVIGYPALARSVVTVSYREGLVRIQRK